MASAAQKRKATRLCENAISASVDRSSEAGLPIFTKKVILWCRWMEGNKRRDPDNVFAGQKFILDAMVNLGVIKDDSQDYVAAIFHTLAIDRVKPRVEVMVRVRESEDEF